MADTLETACASAAWADELIVIDSGSTDATADIAKRMADRYVLEPWRGYTEQKVFGCTLAKHDWIFILDGDEEITPALAHEIRHLSQAQLDQADLFEMPRLNYVMGLPVRAWLPDQQSRLIHRDRITWPDEALHDRREASDPSRIKPLQGQIHHKRTSQCGFADYFSGHRLDARLLLVAEQMHEQGKRATLSDLFFRPIAAFVKFYFFKRGFMAGTFGLLIAQKAAVSVQLKYAALWAVQQGKVAPVSGDHAK